MPVAKLPLATVKLIGSSQVITSVSSVIKELLENAIDAGAKNIEIKLEKHGLEKIEVRDDGCGISCSDIPYVCLPSYTSKISGFSDLENLCSYGFRGEALSSLCAVSQVSITTKTSDDVVAKCFSFGSSGDIISSKPSHLPKGTTVCAAELFKCLPVRKQLMSSTRRASEELRKVENVVKLIAVVHPRLRVTLTHNKFLIWQKTSVNNLRQSVTQVFAQSVVSKLQHIHYSDELVKLEMMIPKRDCDVSSLCLSSISDAFCIFINKRPVIDKKIQKVVLDELTQYFGHYLPTNKYPVCIIVFSVPTNTLDVNLEPNKTRVLLQHMDEILESVKGQLRLYYYEPLLAQKQNGEEENNDTKSYKKRKVESSQSTETFVATNNSSFVNHDECKDYVETTDKINHQQDANYFLKGSMNDEIVSQTHLTQNKEGDYTIQVVEMEDSDDRNLNVEKVSGDNTVNRNYSVLEPTSKEERLIRTDECIVSTVETHEYSFNTENVVSHGMATLNDTCSSMSKDQTILHKNSGDVIRNVKNVKIDKFVTKTNQRHCSKDFDKGNTVAVWITNGACVDEKIINSKHINESSCDNIKNLSIGPKIHDEKYVKNIEACFNNDTCKETDTLTVSQWSRGEVDSVEGDKQGTCVLENKTTALENQLKCVDGYLHEYVTYDGFRSQLANEEVSSVTEVASKLVSEMSEEKSSQGVEECVRESNKDTHSNGMQIPNTDRWKNVVQKYNEKDVIETEINFTEFKNFTDSSHMSEEDRCIVIGQLEASPLWLYCRNNEIGVTSVVRLQEAVQFQKNLESMSIPIKKLESNILVSKEDLGSALWDVLLSLQKRDQCVADERITKNGFIIEISDDPVDDIRATITYTALHIAYYGLDELIELLHLIKDQDQILSLMNFRPLKVISYIRSETMRQCYLSASSYINESVSNLLFFWFEYVKPNCETCIHHKPVVLSLPV